MPRPSTLDQLTRYVLGASAVLVLSAFVWGGFDVGVGSLVGAAFGLVSWASVRWLGARLMVANARGRVMIGMILAAKSLVSLTLVGLILSTGHVNPIGFIVGFSGLIGGIVVGALHLALSGDLSLTGGPSAAAPGVGSTGNGD